MANVNQHIFIEGSFHDLALELAEYLNNSDEIKPLLEKNEKDEALKKLVTSSQSLNSIPEREFTAAYNLLIYLVFQSPNVNIFLPRMCDALTKPITSSPLHGTGLALNALSTIFNLLADDNDVRFNVFQAIVKLIKLSGQWEILKPQLVQLDQWIEDWEVDEEDQRKLYGQLAEIADDVGETEESYKFILKALTTFEGDEASSEEAQKLSTRALRVAFLSPTRYDFHDLTALAPIQALNDVQPVWAELLDILSEKELEDYNDFRDENEDFFEKAGLDNSKLHRKMRLLTMASVCASQNSTREVEYKHIAKALQIPVEEVETWVIDVIRAGLVEGKLSQESKTFLVHKTTYRVFGEKQWRELATRIENWKVVLKQSREIISRERQAAESQKERELQDADKKVAGFSGARRQGGQYRDKDMIDVGAD